MANARGKAYKKVKAKKNVFTVNIHYCRSELETLQLVARNCGWEESTVGGNLYWFGLPMLEKDIRLLSKGKAAYFNRYP